MSDKNDSHFPMRICVMENEVWEEDKEYEKLRELVLMMAKTTNFYDREKDERARELIREIEEG